MVVGVAVGFRAGFHDAKEPIDRSRGLRPFPQIPDHVGVDDAAHVVVPGPLAPPEQEPALPGEVAEHRPPMDGVERGDGAEQQKGEESAFRVPVVDHQAPVVRETDPPGAEDHRDASHVVDVGRDEGVGAPAALHRSLVPVPPQAVAVHLPEEVGHGAGHHPLDRRVGDGGESVDDRRGEERRVVGLDGPAGEIPPRPLDGELPGGELARGEESEAALDGRRQGGGSRSDRHRSLLATGARSSRVKQLRILRLSADDSRRRGPAEWAPPAVAGGAIPEL